MKRIVLAGFFLILVVLGIGGWTLTSYLDTPLGGDTAVDINVERGSNLRAVLGDMAAFEVLKHPKWLYAYARLTQQTALRAGLYEARSNQSPRQLLAMLLKGAVKTESFTLAEGLNRWQVRDALVGGHWIDAARFDSLCDDAAFLKQHNIPGPSCDGYLFPETYTFARGVASEKLFEAMFAAFLRNYEAVTQAGRGPLDLDMRRFVTLASIVEKETGAAQERPRIACVFYNRLRAKPVWRLDTDPTVIYAATLEDPNFDGNIKRHHLRNLKNPYNTYTNNGLPPGPISSPGRAALEAVAAPAECGDFFFVSMNNGKHVFCPDLACHNAAVNTWQIQYFRKKRP
ncbi:MAG: endolytic transglycosylase MltG [Myxococcota bacterium]